MGSPIIVIVLQDLQDTTFGSSAEDEIYTCYPHLGAVASFPNIECSFVVKATLGGSLTGTLNFRHGGSPGTAVDGTLIASIDLTPASTSDGLQPPTLLTSGPHVIANPTTGFWRLKLTMNMAGNNQLQLVSITIRGVA